jgi:hypothetical protein
MTSAIFSKTVEYEARVLCAGIVALRHNSMRSLKRSLPSLPFATGSPGPAPLGLGPQQRFAISFGLVVQPEVAGRLLRLYVKRMQYGLSRVLADHVQREGIDRQALTEQSSFDHGSEAGLAAVLKLSWDIRCTGQRLRELLGCRPPDRHHFLGAECPTRRVIQQAQTRLSASPCPEHVARQPDGLFVRQSDGALKPSQPLAERMELVQHLGMAPLGLGGVRCPERERDLSGGRADALLDLSTGDLDDEAPSPRGMQDVRRDPLPELLVP